MLVINAFLLTISTISVNDGYDQFLTLTSMIDDQVEWIDKSGSHTLKRNEALRLLDELSNDVDRNSYAVRHLSDWKNSRCFRIIHLETLQGTTRVFFQCSQKKSGPVVTKIKIDQL